MNSLIQKYSRIIVLCLCSFLCWKCGQNNSTTTNTSVETTQLAPPQEDDLLMRLSAEMTSDTGRTARERNAIVDFAIEDLRNIYPTTSGLFYEIIEQGDGAEIQWADHMKVHYKGTFLDGTVFADSKKQNKPLEFYVGAMISAWNEGIKLVNVGGKIHLYSPSDLAYGEKGLQKQNGDFLVPPNQILKFEIEVLEKIESN